MERRKAFLVAGAVTISALAGATAVGATTGLLGFAGLRNEPTPAAAATDASVTETRIVHLPGRATVTTAPHPAPAPGTSASPTVPAPSADHAPPATAPPGTPSAAATTVQSAAGPTPTVAPKDDTHEVEPPQPTQPPEHETEAPEVDQPETPQHDG